MKTLKLHIRDRSIITVIFLYATIIILLQTIRFTIGGFYIPSWDEAHNLLMGFKYYEALSEFNYYTLSDLFLNSKQIYPPLFHIAIAFLYAIFGIVPKVGIYVNLIFVYILIFSTYNLGGIISKQVGLISAILTPVLPIFLTLQESALVDYASTSLFILLYYLLFKTNYFENKKYSFYFGICLSLNLLTKWTFVVPSIPFLFYLVVSLIKKLDKPKAFNLIIIFVLSIPGFIWNISNSSTIIGVANFFKDKSNFPHYIYNTPSGFTLKNILLYSYDYAVGPGGVGISVLVLFSISIYILVLKRKLGNHLKYFFTSIFIYYLFLTFITNKADKYLSYLAPLVIIIIVSSLFSINQRGLRLAGLLILTVLVFANTILGYSVFYKPHLKLKIMERLKLDKYHYIFPGYTMNITNDTWPTNRILSVIPNDRDSAILVIPDHKNINPINLNYYSVITGYNFNITAGYTLFNPKNVQKPNVGRLRSFDYIITKDGDPGIFASKEILDGVNNYLETSDEFQLLETYNIPDNNHIFIYERIYNYTN